MRKTKKTLFALCFVVLFGGVLSIFSQLLTPAAHADTTTDAQIQACYDKYNGKPTTGVIGGATDPCVYGPDRPCVPTSNTADAVYKCQDLTAQHAAAAAEVAPLVKLVCGDAPGGAAAYNYYQDCSNKVKGIYTSCTSTVDNDTHQTDHSTTSSIHLTAQCASPKLNQISGGQTATEPAVESAITSGRSDAKKILDDAATKSAKQTCEDGGGTWTADNTCTAAKTDAVCTGGTLGWILCPISDLAVQVTNMFADLMQKLLTFSPLLTSDQGKAIQAVWQLIVNIANIMLVIVFLVVVFSQATSMGLSSYGIKKMLPKIIAAAILMNLSFFICAVAVDITNILGQSVGGIIQVGINALPDPPAGIASQLRQGSSGLQNFTFSALIAVVTAGLIVTGQIAIVLPVVIAAACAVFTAFAVIVFRQVAIVILIILSPLAFVAWVLPNTEKWFKRWQEAFLDILMMFPLIMGIFYGAAFVSNIILITLDPSKSGLEEWAVKLIALAVLVLPLFAFPFILKTIGGVLDRFGAAVNNRQKGLIDRSRNWSRDTAKRGRANTTAGLAKWGREKRNKGYDEESGNKLTGKRNRARRMIGGTANFIGGFGARQHYKHTQQEANANRIQEELIYEQLADTNPEGSPTGSAQRFATSAAGVGGAKSAERIRRLALEQRKAELMADVKREAGALTTMGAFSPGAYYFEYDKNGKLIDHYQDHGRAMTAIARGDKVGVVKAGDERNEENAKKNMYVGDSREKQYAAMQRMASIADGAALGYALYGGKVKDHNGNDRWVKALGDKQIDDFNQFISDNAGGISPKLSHLITMDNGLNGVKGAGMANWHGNEFAVAASRIRQLRESGSQDDLNAANKIQSAVEAAYKTLSTDPNLKQQFNQKHVSAMEDFNNILSGKEGRLVMREYGDKMEDSKNQYLDTRTNRIINPNGTATVNVHPLSGNAVAQGFTVRGGYSAGGTQVPVSAAAAPAAPGAATPGVAPGAAAPAYTGPPVNYNAPAAAANAGQYTRGLTARDLQRMQPNSANMIVQNAGGMRGLTDDDVSKLAIAFHAGGDAIAQEIRREAQNRNIPLPIDRTADAQQRAAAAAQGNQTPSAPTYTVSSSGTAQPVSPPSASSGTPNNPSNPNNP